jgi:ABC-type long-subunit fatty acid transport system fused permease/ATPase subunit
MKSKAFWVIFSLLFFYLFSTDLYAQSSNNEQRLVGTWILEAPFLGNSEYLINSVFTFSSNGTLTIVSSTKRMNGKWAINANKMVFILDGDDISLSLFSYEFYITSNGDTMLLTVSDGNLFGMAIFSGKFRKR